jgi:hypothetical protein
MGSIDVLHRLRRWRYRAGVGPSRRLPVFEPIRHMKVLDDYVGYWVALKDGAVKAAAKTSIELAEELHKRHIQGATILFVEPPTTAERVGLG